MNRKRENEGSGRASDAVDGLFAELDPGATEDGSERPIPITQPADELTQLKAQLDQAEKQALLAQADLENFRRRTRRDTQEQLKYASLSLMNGLLDVVDNLHRAIETHEPTGEPNAGDDGLLEGVKLVEQQILALLESNGCRKIESVGQPFDPNLHQAVQMHSSEQYDANVVMQELRTGFQLHDRVIRPSQVFVSTGPTARE